MSDLRYTTAVLGASPNPNRYAYRAVERLKSKNIPVILLGFRKGKIAEEEIILNWPARIENLHTLTLYVGPKRQPDFYDYIVQLKPRRVIFNPGTENIELYKLLQSNHIHFEEACTLVLLNTNQYQH